MTTPHVNCLSHLPTAHEPASPSDHEPAMPSGGVADACPAISANWPADRAAVPVTLGPMSASLPRSAACVIPVLR